MSEPTETRTETPNPPFPGLPRAVLFVCNQNAIRSPMAKALLDKHTSRRIFSDSVGITSGYTDLFTEEVVREAGGARLDGHRPKTLQDITLADYDLVVTLSIPAEERLRSVLKDRLESEPGLLEYWQTPDPGDGEGSRDQVLDAYRLVRDHLEVRIADRFPLD